MNEDFGLDVWMEDQLNGGYGYVLDEMGEDDPYAGEWEDSGEWDDDPNPYDGDYSEE